MYLVAYDKCASVPFIHNTSFIEYTQYIKIASILMACIHFMYMP